MDKTQERLLFDAVQNAETDNFLELAKLAGLDIKRDFAGADLSGVDLAGTDLTKCDFSDADFSNANLSNTNFTEARLNRVNFLNAKLTNANLTKADLSGSSFEGAVIDGAIFQNSVFSFRDQQEFLGVRPTKKVGHIKVISLQKAQSAYRRTLSPDEQRSLALLKEIKDLKSKFIKTESHFVHKKISEPRLNLIRIRMTHLADISNILASYLKPIKSRALDISPNKENRLDHKFIIDSLLEEARITLREIEATLDKIDPYPHTIRVLGGSTNTRFKAKFGRSSTSKKHIRKSSISVVREKLKRTPQIMERKKKSNTISPKAEKRNKDT